MHAHWNVWECQPLTEATDFQLLSLLFPVFLACSVTQDLSLSWPWLVMPLKLKELANDTSEPH